VDEGTLRAIQDRQLPPEEKARRADVVVENDGGLTRLREQAEKLWAGISGEKGSEGGVGQGA
jgi:dephospho-CoA kinase